MDVIDNHKTTYNFLNENYKEQNTIFQLFSQLNKNELFCFKYCCVEECNQCNINKTTESFLIPIMTFGLNNNCNSNIKELIYSNFKNDL